MSADRWLAWALWVMGIVSVLLVVACMEINLQRYGNRQQQDGTTESDRPLKTVKRRSIGR